MIRTTRASRAGSRVSRFVFTLNNWTQEEYDFLTTTFAEQVRWIVIGREVGESGTPHLQGACILGTQWSFSKLKTMTGLSRSHIELMKGKPEDSRVYCTKEDVQPFEKGSLPQQGARSDIRQAAERILQGTSLKELARDKDIGAVAVIKYFKGLTVLRSLTRPARKDPPIVYWVFGKTGTGKTRCCFESARRYVGGNDDLIWISSGGLKWFDGYDGQPVAIFDDFRAKHVQNFAFLLRLLDRYPIGVEFKGGFVNWTPSVIFITCPEDPDTCFSTRKQHVPEDIEQLHRRIRKVHHFKDHLDDEAREAFSNSIIQDTGLYGEHQGDMLQSGVEDSVPSTLGESDSSIG